MKTKTTVTGLFAAAVLAIVLAPPLQAQDSRWQAFVGCWEPIDGGDEAGLLCFRPSGAGVEMFNVVSGEVTSSEQLVADGQRRSVTADGCEGGESVAFSEDGLRAFTASEFDCEGETRAGTGVMSLITPTQWIDVRSLEVDGEPVAWVQRYALATSDLMADHGVEDPAAADRLSIRAMRVRASRDIDLADVEEAIAKIDARAVEVWVATNETRLELSGAELVRLADAGVPESLIDVMVAVSYPSQFVLSPEGAPDEALGSRVTGDGYRGGYRGFRSFLWDPFYGYSPFGFGYNRYSRYGYYGLGYGGGGYGGYYGYRPVAVVVQPRSTGSRGGRMIAGQGYTRGGSGSGGGARPSYSGQGGSGAASRGGGGGGRSSGSSGRTAQPRGR